MEQNLAIDFINDLNNYDGLIRGPNLNCNILFLKVKITDEISHYAVKRPINANDNNATGGSASNVSLSNNNAGTIANNDEMFESMLKLQSRVNDYQKSSFRIPNHRNYIVYQPSQDEINMYENTLKKGYGGKKLCQYSVNERYINESYTNSDFSFLLFTNELETKLNLRKKTKTLNKKVVRRDKLRNNLCGLLFLQEVNANDIYLPLICAKPAIGSKLLQLAENFGKMYNYDNLLLTSLDSPFGFYLKKKYKIKSGRSVFPLSSKAKVKLFSKRANNKYSMNQELLKRGLVMNNLGLTRKVSNLASILPKNSNGVISNRRLKTHAFLNPKSRVDFVDAASVNHNNDGVRMIKKLRRFSN